MIADPLYEIGVSLPRLCWIGRMQRNVGVSCAVYDLRMSGTRV